MGEMTVLFLSVEFMMKYVFMLDIHLIEEMLSRKKYMNHKRYDTVVFGETSIFTDKH